MPGTNHSMVHNGEFFTRFRLPTEDAFLESVSYLRRGSAKKLCYAISPSFPTEFEGYGSEAVLVLNLAKGKMTVPTMFTNKSVLFLLK